MNPDVCILGIDPGSCVTGFGVIAVSGNRFKAIDFGCIRPPSSIPMSQRYRAIFEGVNQVLALYHPSVVSIETQYVDKNVQSAIKLGMARGVVILAAALREIPVFEYSPAKAKRAVVGRGRATKGQVQAMVKHLLSLTELPKPEDAADALALAICHAHTVNGIGSCTHISAERLLKRPLII